MGWLKYFSDRPGDSSLFLEKAAWVTADYKLVPITGPGLFLTKDSGIRSISFLKWQDGGFNNLREKSRIVPLMWFLAALIGAILGIFYLRLHHLRFGITFFATAVVSIFIGWRSRLSGSIAAPSKGEIIQQGRNELVDLLQFRLQVIANKCALSGETGIDRKRTGVHHCFYILPRCETKFSNVGMFRILMVECRYR